MVANILPISNLRMALENLPIAANGSPLVPICNDKRVLSKVYEVWAKKYRGVICHDTEQWCKNWINLDFVVSKMAQATG